MYILKVTSKYLQLKAPALFKRYFLIAFLLCLFLVRIPPLYIFPVIKNNVLITYGIVALLAIFLFAILVSVSVFSKKFVMFRDKEDKLLATLFIVYFLFQSISVINAFSLGDFIHDYKNIIFSGMFLFLSIFIKENFNTEKYFKKIVFTFFIATVFNFIYQLVIFFFPNMFSTLGSVFIYSNHFDLVLANIARGRIFIETYDEIVLPFVFIIFMKGEKNRRTILLTLLMLIAIAVPSLLSDFRTRILMLGFGFVFSMIFILRSKIITRLIIVLFFTVLVYLSYFLLNSTYGVSFVSRLSLQSNAQDVETIDFRVRNIFYSYDLALKDPITGVGLGNYYNNLPIQKINYSNQNNVNAQLAMASQNPHDIFAQVLSETGFPSLIFFVFMILFFLVSDVKVLIRKSKVDIYANGFIISFWTLFIYSLFNPTVGITYNMLFWMIRVFIVV